MADFTTLISLLDGLAKTLDQLAELERKKASAVRADELLMLDDCMKQEQALILALRGCDSKRENVQKALHLQDVKLRDLPDHCPPEIRAAVQASARALSEKYQVYQAAAEVARNVLECNLHQVEKEIDKLQAQSPRSNAAVHTDFRI